MTHIIVKCFYIQLRETRNTMDNIEYTDKKKYKFKELKLYTSTEWLADNKKKYRQVFDRYEVAYIYAELAFYNKSFDEDIWEAEVTLKCYQIKPKKSEVCVLDFKKKISKYDSTVYIREGWGNKKGGAFWKKGTYYWEAYIDGEKLGSKYFYVEDAGQDYTDALNPYLRLETLKLYEGQLDDVPVEERTYLKTFSSEATRYIYTELTFKNLFPKNWHCELFIKFMTNIHDIKGKVNRLINVKKGEEKIVVTAGWGSNIKGSWRNGEYSLEVIFMDRLLAVVDFIVDETIEEGDPEVYLPEENRQLGIGELAPSTLTFDEVMLELESLIGLNKIKQKVKDHAQYIKFLQLRKKKGFKELRDIDIHSVFTGNPGTGKTTVAKMMGQLYFKMGLLTKGHVHEVDRVDLVGEYIGQTAPKVKEAIEKARGGVLFIDEAYSLARSNDDSKDFGREVIEILVKEMSNGKGDMAVIVAGYPQEMKTFLESNPGLRSRFKEFYRFDDYTPSELMQIADYACKEMEITLNDDARLDLEQIVIKSYRKRTKNFGNARYINDLLQKSKINLGIRTMERKNPMSLGERELMAIQKKDLIGIQSEHFRKVVDLPIDEKLLDEAMQELNALVGISNVKEQIQELISIVRFHKKNDRSVVSNFYLHTIFVGNPGTGKTTVARILTKIYKALGILERGHMVETDRQGLVAGFVGQTAIKTTERIDEAMGGVLFIDEAYALSNFNGLQGDYGNEAIQTILKRMEDDRGEFFVFAAGYPDNMEKFLKANPGLTSRFDKTFHFEDYTSDQLFEIAEKMVKDQKMRLTSKASKKLKEILLEIYKFRDKYFGNARTVRKIVLELIKHQNLRFATMDIGAKSKQSEMQITYEDVLQLDILSEKDAFNQQGIGFNH